MNVTSTISYIKPLRAFRGPSGNWRRISRARVQLPGQFAGIRKQARLRLLCLTVCLSTLFFAAASFSAVPQIEQREEGASNSFLTGEVIGKTYQVAIRPDDTLHSVARRFHTGLEELRLANPSTDTWLPDVTRRVTIPAQFVLPAEIRADVSQGAESTATESTATLAVINLPEMRLYLKRESVVTTYPVSVGRPGWPTPGMDTTVTQKRVNPSWRPPASIIEAARKSGEKIAPLYLPGPSNPLGKYAIRLGQTAYLIHGTNKPSGVGVRASHGCIRMYPEHVEILFGRLLPGDRVAVVDEPVKVGWHEDQLFMEVHPPLEESGLDDSQLLEKAIALAEAALLGSTNSLAGVLDRDKIGKLVSEQMGVPAVIN